MKNNFLILSLSLFYFTISLTSCRDDDGGGTNFPNGSEELTLQFNFEDQFEQTFCVVSTDDRRVYFDTIFLNNVGTTIVKVPLNENVHITIGTEDESSFNVQTFANIENEFSLFPSSFSSCNNSMTHVNRGTYRRMIVLNNVDDCELIQDFSVFNTSNYDEIKRQFTFQGLVYGTDVSGAVHAQLLAIREKGSEEVKGLVIDNTADLDTLEFDFESFNTLEKHYFYPEEEGRFSIQCFAVNESGSLSLGSTKLTEQSKEIEYYLPESLTADQYEVFFRGSFGDSENIFMVKLYDYLPSILNFGEAKVEDSGSKANEIKFEAIDNLDYLNARLDYGFSLGSTSHWTVNIANPEQSSIMLPDIPKSIFNKFPLFEEKVLIPLSIFYTGSQVLDNAPIFNYNSTAEGSDIRCHYRVQRTSQFSLD